MKSFLKMVPLMIAALVLTACKGGKEYEVTYFAFQAEQDGDWGMMDTNGNVLFAEEFENGPGPAINDRFYLYDSDEEAWCIYAAEKRPRKIGQYKDVGCFTIGLCPVVDSDGFMRYIDKEGNTAFEMKKVGSKKVTTAYAFYNGRALIKLENDKYGYIDQTGKVVIPCKYINAWSFNDGVALVYNDEEDADNGRWSIIDTEGNVLFTKKFREMTPETYKFSDGFMIVSTNGKLGVLNKEGQTVCKVKGTSANDIYNGRFVFYDSNSEKYGLASVDGNVLIRARYSTLAYNGAILAGSTDDDRFYLLTMEGEKIAKLPKGYPTLFEPYFPQWDQRLLVGSYDEGYKLVDAKGNKINTEDIAGVSTTFFTLAIAPAVEEEDEEIEVDYD